jgi:hypothetical protein
MGRMGETAIVPEGLNDGSLARSAWEPDKFGIRPVGHGVIVAQRWRRSIRQRALSSSPMGIDRIRPYPMGRT